MCVCVFMDLERVGDGERKKCRRKSVRAHFVESGFGFYKMYVMIIQLL